MLDDVDLAILRCLKKNARERACVISKQVNLSVSAVTERIRRMEKSGVIQNYTVQLDERRLGYGIETMIEVDLEHLRFYDSFAAKVASEPSIISCYSLTGDVDFMLRIVTDSTESLERLYMEIKNMEGVSTTKTYFILQHMKTEITRIPDTLLK